MTAGFAAGGKADSGVRVTARHFRNYRELALTIAPTWTLLVGPNGAGKTNFLELLAVSLRGLVLRGRLADLILHGENDAVVRVTLASSDTTETEFVRREQGIIRTRYWNDELRPAPENVLPRVVLFLPHEEELFESAEGRRRLLGRALALHSERHRQQVLEYQRILAQRNRLLRSSRDVSFFSREEWAVWTEQIINLACAIWEARIRYLKTLNDALPRALAELGGVPGEPTLSLSLGGYHATVPTVPTPADLSAAFQEIRHQEARAGITLLGPHRDRVHVMSEGRDALPFLSRGQRRALLLALHLIEGQHAREESGGVPPLYLFDDVFSELDAAHRAAVVTALQQETVVVTSADERIAETLPQRSIVARVAAGAMHRV